MYAMKSARALSRSLQVDWQDGFSKHFPYVWLRDNGHRRPSLIHLDLNAKPEDVVCKNGSVQVIWPPFLTSQYSSRFLRDHSKMTPIHSTKCPVTKKVLTVPWRVQRKPDNEDHSNTATLHWGDIAMDHGTVFPHMERVPSIVTVGTEWANARVHLVDAVQCLSEMSRLHPDEFAFLAKSFIEYEGGFFKATHPTATIENGRIIAAVFNNDLRSPEITTDSIDDFYASLKAFNMVCCDNLHTLTLNPGDLLVVDNAQTLLGAPAQAGRLLHIKVYC